MRLRKLKHPLRFTIIISLIVILVLGGSGFGAFYLTSSRALARENQKIALISDAQKRADALNAKTNKDFAAKVKTALEAKAAAEAAAKDAEAKAKAANIPVASLKSCSTPNAHSDPSRIDVIANKKHCLQPIDYKPNLVTIDGATISVAAKDDFVALMNAASAAGQQLCVTSSYRSYDDQVSTYNYWVSISGQAGADEYSARPGYSEHQTGLAIDFCAGSAGLSDFTGTSQQQWMATNAWQYGWIQRYTEANTSITGYEAESWHFRYVGRTVAAAYHNTGANSLEEFWGISGGLY